MRLNLAIFSIFALLHTPCWAAEPISLTTLQQWIEADQVLTLDITDGKIFTREDLPALSSVIPPGYITAFDFPELQIEIQKTADYVPHPDYLKATDQYAGSSTLLPDGAIQGHIAGLPFSHMQIKSAEKREAGFMTAWNNIFRWHYYGYRAKPVTMFYLRTNDESAGGKRPAGIAGNAKIERSVEMWFHRVYLSRLAMLPGNNYLLDAAGDTENHYKDFMEITAPFDVAGAKFIIERSLDPYEEDQVNSYLPTERRVRRLSAQERADTFLGTDYTFDDFEGFSGRVMDYEWELLGEKTILAVADSKHERIRVYGPQSIIPDDRWQLRDCYVLAMIPRWEKHPYGVKFMFLDKQTWLVHVAMIFDRNDKHWKSIDPIWQYPEFATDPQSPSATVGRWIATIGSDLLQGTSTVSQGEKTDIPAMKKSTVKRLFDVSSLNEGR